MLFALFGWAFARVDGGQSPQSFGFPIVISYSSADTGADGFTFSAKQGSDGTLFFGGNRIHTFDGERWHHHAIAGAYGFFGMDMGPDQKLWVGGVGELGWFEPAKGALGSFHSLRSHLSTELMPTGPIYQVFADIDHIVFVAEDRILRWDGSEFEVWIMPRTRRLTAARVNGTVYIHHRERGVFALRPHGPQLVFPQDLFGGELGVHWMEEFRGQWTFGTSQGMVRYVNGRMERFAPEVSNFLRDQAVTCGIRLADGRIAFGSFRGGIAVMNPDGSLDRVLNKEAGLIAPSITSLFVDRAGSLWATSPSHISRIELLAPTAVFDERAELPPQVYRTIASAEGVVFAGSESRVYEMRSDERRKFSPSALFENKMTELRGAGTDLIAVGYRGAWRIQADRRETIHRTDFDIFATAPSVSSPGQVLLADSQAIVGTAPDRSVSVVLDRLPDSARSIGEDETGRVWAGTIAKGLWHGLPESDRPAIAQPVPAALGLPPLVGMTHVRGNADGTILVVADNGAWVKPRGAQRFAAIAGYPVRSVAAVSVTDERRTWVVHLDSPSGTPAVGRITTDATGGRWESHSVIGLEAIGRPRSILGEIDASGEPVLWIGGASGLVRHAISGGVLSTPVPTRPLLRAFTRDSGGVRVPLGADALPYSTPSVEFEFAHVDFARRAQIRLETRIDGIDADWIPAGKEARRELTASRDGTYAMAVRAVAENGRISEHATVAFRILPPWWRTLPAVLGFVAGLLPLGYGTYRLRLRTLRRRNAELETKVRQRTDELEKANAAKTEFVANMSHDIRNPLNGIVGLALALEDTRLDSKQRELVATLRECTTYLSSLVDDVLDFASIEAGRVELRPGPFAPAELLRSIVTTLKSDTAEGGATLRVEVDPALPAHLSGDAGRIQQILVNYVSNALKYAGGEIHLTATIPLDSPDEVEFSVSDSGGGVSAAEQATLFTKFTRLSQARQHDIPGAGLGLASCRLLADIMGGSVGIDSQPGVGARFFLRLPLAAAVAAPAPVTGHLPNTTVLLVEDTDYNALAATAVLGRLGLTCERAHTGAEALQMFAAKRFNLVLLDRNLPDMDGTEVARRLRKLETDGLQSIILAVTAYCTAEDRQLCLDAGMDAFVGKPLTPDKLRKVLLAAGRRMLAAATFDAASDVAPRSPVSPVSATPVKLDTSLLTYLSDGSTDGFRQQVDRFAATLLEAQVELVRTTHARDCKALRLAAHRLVGQAKMIGAAALAESGTRLEVAARASKIALAAEMLPDVTREIADVMAALHRRRSTELTA